ncbi:hypothetical protein [Streptomyces sp. HUAS TT7]|uniref:hypothetical protein n=1 Tax=Streptomyces sp. HUAS TT7 TaxID=3447507 RepID=UPI003F65DE2E
MVGALAAGLGVAAIPAAAAQPATAERDSPAEATAASAQAARSGQQVEVVSQRTAYATVYANPDGTFTQDTSVTPVRTKVGKRLVDIDATLAAAPDGTVVPKAAAVGLVFSGGGSTPLVTITRDGRSMSVD